MRQCGTARRIVREPGKTFHVWIPVYYSEAAGRYHRGLPDFLAEFRHYAANTIRASENNDPDLDLFDYPSDSTRARWHARARSGSFSPRLVSFIGGPSYYIHPLLWPGSARRL